MTDSQTCIEIHAIFNGKVQGVCFRATTQKHAKKLGLLGTVRNMSDGSVEIYIFGLPQTIKKLFHLLQSEFSISSLSQTEISPSRIYDNFQIL